MIISDVSLALLFLLVVFVDCGALLFQRLDYHIYAIVSVLHDQAELLMSGFLLFFIVIVSPHQRDTIGVVKVPLDSFKSRKSEPADETAYIFKFVVGFQDQKDLRTV